MKAGEFRKGNVVIAEATKQIQGIRCPNCKEVIVSTYRHDFRVCPCGSVFVDGGRDYLRYGTTGDKPVDESAIQVVNINPSAAAGPPKESRK